jgi:hypothetical protein
MANKRATELHQYVVRQKEKNKEGGRKTTYQYFMNQKDAKAWAAGKPGKKDLFKLNTDFYGELK